ncbi:MAG: prephenate dehydrogenase/arogenate dehydrogenase family protein [Candidatus Dadabacteria bacterium]|nr:prephenate dehydrogenase/arogenate dehydrogenase family protein [Candidatus Dadabacteria bacterium]
MKFDKVTIIGLGLIGGSLARALKGSGSVEEVCGVDADRSALKFAVSEGVVHTASAEIEEAVRGAEVVVVATHVGIITEVAKSAAEAVGNGAVITDVGSVKGWIVVEMERSLPEGVSFVGAHPIAGTERSGVRHSDGELFNGKLLIVTPTASTDPGAVEKVSGLWRLAGAEVVPMEPQVHDRIFGFVSHLPHVVAYALINAVAAQDDPPGMMGYSGGGLRDYTRIAESSPEMWRDIVLMNRDNVLSAIKEFKAALEKIERMVESGDSQGLEEEFQKSASAKREGG